MGERIQQQKVHTEREPEQVVEADMPVRETGVDINEVDRLLDEIDLILEENAEEFVAAYRQKGGE